MAIDLANAGQSLFSDNPYFTAGFGLLGVGTVVAGARSAILRLSGVVQRRYLSTVEVNSRDPSFRALSLALSRLLPGFASGNHLSVGVTASGQLSYIPGPGTHYFRHGRTWIRLERTRERSPVDLGLAGGSGPFETLTLTCLGRANPALRELLAEAWQEAVAENADRLQIYTAFAAEWRPFGPAKRRRLLDSVVLRRGVRELLLDDLCRFLSASGWYHARGIPYRRGYLLHGPPGGGKSSLVQALAGHLDFSLCTMSLSDPGLSDDRLAHLLSNLPPRSLLLIEDIDTAGPSRFHGPLVVDPAPRHGHNHSQYPGNTITLSGLLNAIDGVAAGEEGRILLMTSNHPDRLDPALIRPGRIDLSVEIGWADAEQAGRMFRRFYPEALRQAAVFRDRLGPAIPVSPAAIQGLFIEHPDSPEAVLRDMDKLFPESPVLKGLGKNQLLE